jgi:hypothetical protein
LAQTKDRQLLDNLQTAMGKRQRSLGLIISTHHRSTAACGSELNQHARPHHKARC